MVFEDNPSKSVFWGNNSRDAVSKESQDVDLTTKSTPFLIYMKELLNK